MLAINEEDLLVNMAFLLLAATVCNIIFKRAKMPTIIGYLLTGIICANYWDGMSESTNTIVELLADLGLVLLMFTIGMELNIQKLKKMGGFAAVVVLIMIPIMLFAGYVLGAIMGFSLLEAIFMGIILSGSSTAVFIAVSHESGALSQHEIERLILIMVMEDVAQVLMLSMTSPLIAGETMSVEAIVWMVIIIVVFIVTMMTVGLHAIPLVLEKVENRFSNEVLLIVSLAFCFGITTISVSIGLSEAIGAFLTGVAVSQARAHEKVANSVEPMKNIFMAMYFVSIGLMIKPEELLDNIVGILLIYIMFAIMKSLSTMVAYLVANRDDNSYRHGFVCAVSLLAMGEFAFIISSQVFGAETSPFYNHDLFVSVIGAALLSMITLPILSRKSATAAQYVYDVCPGCVYRPMAAAKVFFKREGIRLRNASEATRKRVRGLFAYSYINAIVVFVILVSLYFFSVQMGDFIAGRVNGDETLCGVAVLFIAFMVLSLPLYTMFANLRNLLQSYSELHINEPGGRNPEQKTLFQRLNINLWILVGVVDFVLLLFIKSGLPFSYHVLVTAVGSGLIILAVFLGNWNRSRRAATMQAAGEQEEVAAEPALSDELSEKE